MVGVLVMVPTEAAAEKPPTARPKVLAWLSSVPVAFRAKAPLTVNTLPVPTVATTDGLVVTIAGLVAAATPPNEPASVVSRVVLMPAALTVSAPAVRCTPLPR